MRLPVYETQISHRVSTTALLLFMTSAPVAFILAWHIHIIIFPCWILLWGLAMIPHMRFYRARAQKGSDKGNHQGNHQGNHKDNQQDNHQGDMRPNRLYYCFILAILAIILFTLYKVQSISAAPFFMMMVLLLSATDQIDGQGRPKAFNLLGIIFPALCVMVLSAELFLFVLLLVCVTLYTGLFVLRFNDIPLADFRIRLLPLFVGFSVAFLIAIVIFLALPRLNTAQLPGFINGDRYSGVTDRLDIGQFSKVVQNNEIAFRAFMQTAPGNGDLYWRVYLLTQDENGKWTRGAISSTPALKIIARQKSDIAYQIRHARPGQIWLPVLGSPAFDTSTNKTIMSNGGEIIIADKRDRRTKTWAMKSLLTDRTEAHFPQSTLIDGHPRLRQWAVETRAAMASDADFVRHLLALFGSGGFRYTLTPPTNARQLTGDRLDNFFFDIRQGYCSHFAMTMATVLRAASSPANVVVGYTGGAWNEFGNYVLVRQSDAHAWVEARLDGGAWQRFDPTLLVPTLDGGAAEVSAVATQPQRDNRLWTKLKRSLQWADNFFVQLNNDILNYDNKARENLFGELNGGKILSYITFWVLGTICLFAPFFLLRFIFAANPLIALDRQFARLAAKIKLKRHAFEGRLDFATRMAQTAPQAQQEIKTYVNQWCRVFFTTAIADRQTVKEMKYLLRQMRKKIR